MGKQASTPHLGVLVSRKQIRLFMRQAPSWRLKALVRANRNAGINLFFFCIDGVNVRKKKILGVYYDVQDKKYKKRLFSYPDVLYKRGRDVTNKRSVNRKYRTFQAHLKALNVQYINYQQGFDKWKVYQTLSSNTSLQPYLPETKVLTSASELAHMLAAHKTVYVKAAKGRKGQQVIRVETEADGSFTYTHYLKGLKTKHVHTIDELFDALKTFFKGRFAIVQEGIKLLKIDDKIIDIRAELQRNGQGDLGITAVSVRESQKNSPITTHADSYPIDDFCAKVLNYSPARTNELKKRINALVRAVYAHIENENGQVGELGIDLALDEEGRLWFIEVNSQTAKVSLCKAYGEEVKHKAFYNPLAYAAYIYHKKD
ncbi:YheC/D-like protein [Salsuginibacillus halophilus]|uniref:YheC/D-like protein n=1 Tax=Salsuginibacillus halophilus TaxID=517424 RepID=A0A2P8H8P9_9BACI|nr:YheC/YheD family protein [Salsuginibacillus halophilus]PSL42584.1 YheC/D-like protein [Salsuginibacillus halophilus]